MQEIIKQVGSSRQLFETVNFAFMKIFDLLVKIALFTVFLGAINGWSKWSFFGHFLFFGRFASCIAAVIKNLIRAEINEANLSDKEEIP